MSDRNCPVMVPAVNPKPENPMSNDTGNAGADGYSVLSRASRYGGKERPPVGGYPEYGPLMSNKVY